MNLTYELAQELKDVGFPFIRYPEYSSEYPLNRYGKGIHFGDRKLYCEPTLEELIDACGDREKQFELRRKGNGWVASDFFRGGREVWGNGKTPLEAVAKLYIALNKK